MLAQAAVTAQGPSRGPKVRTLSAEVAEVIRTTHLNFGERLDRMRYSLLRRTVTQFLPAAVLFDEADPVLGAGFVLEAGPDIAR